MLPELTSSDLVTHPLGYRYFPHINQADLDEYYTKTYQDPLATDVEWLEKTLWWDILAYNNVVGKWLDIGSGGGTFASWLAQCEINVETVDPMTQNSTTYQSLGEIKSYQHYDVVTLMNVLEHVADADAFLNEVTHSLCHDQTELVVRVPNDFSPLQIALMPKHGEYWVHYPDHINYFSPQFLKSLLNKHGWHVDIMHCDFPMEYFILMDIDYISNPSLGQKAHTMRRNMEMALPKYMRRDLWRVWGQQGIGRNIIAYASKKE